MEAVAGKARETSAHTDDRAAGGTSFDTVTGESAPASTKAPAAASKASTAGKQPERGAAAAPAGRGAADRSSPSLDLGFMSAQFQVPDWHLPDWRLPNRGDLDAATRGARSMLPSRKAMLFMGGLAVTAVAGVIEWPVAAAIGVGSVLAARGGEGSESSEPAGSGSGTTAASAS